MGSNAIFNQPPKWFIEGADSLTTVGMIACRRGDRRKTSTLKCSPSTLMMHELHGTAMAWNDSIKTLDPGKWAREALQWLTLRSDFPIRGHTVCIDKRTRLL